jgi:hypothetical protein
VTLDDMLLDRACLDAIDWRQIITAAESKDCDKYSVLFNAKAKEAETSGDNGACIALQLLGAVTSLMLRSEDTGEPFAPIAVFGAWRSASIDDFTDQQLDVLKDWVRTVEDPELRARVADVVWVRRRGDYRTAETAIDSVFAVCLLLG